MTARMPVAPLRFTHLDQPRWPGAEPGASPVRKGEYLAYLRAVSPCALAHLRGRPLVLTRYPEGAGGPSFYQKNIPEHTPRWLPVFRDPRPTAEGRHVRYALAATTADLLWLGQQDALEFHAWQSTCQSPDLPDRAVIDLDPMPPSGLAEARAVAALAQRVLELAGVRGWWKTSGATGLHCHIPIRPALPHRSVAEILRALGELLQRACPGLVTLERHVARRGGRVYLDYLQNARGRTLCAAYSPRALPGAPVSLPIPWSEVATVQPGDWTVRTVPARLAQGCDAWADLPGAPAQDLDALARVCRGSVAR